MASSSSDAVTVHRSAFASVHRGHPWIYRTALLRLPRELPLGGEVRVCSEAGEVLGHGVFDPGSPLAVRLWTRGEEPLSPELLRLRITQALARRALQVEDGQTTAYRLIHGEGDRLPGYVVDRYGAIAVLKADGEAASSRVPWFVESLWPLLQAEGIHTLVQRIGGKGGGSQVVPLHGGPLPKQVQVQEYGIPFVVDLHHGQKTGAFLDQRENRRRIGQWAHGRRVLNLFSYTAGFSLHAAKGGATHTTSVDSALEAHATAHASFVCAGLDPKQHAFVTADVFSFLAAAGTQHRTWDLVISDPPSFAPNEKSVPRALSAYRALHRAAIQVLAPGGLFCAASCSSHVSAETFASTVDDTALQRSDLTLLEQHGAPWDHPTLPSWWEGRYLKFFVLG